MRARPAGSAEEMFGPRLPAAERYADLLVTDGVVRGLIGPREAPAIWTRHILNCAVVAELIGPGARIVDVGSGAGLPGIALALARPDVTVDLVEPLERRVRFLEDAVTAVDLDGQVRIVRGRAESWPVRRQVGGADVVTARAVAPLPTLIAWCLPLLRPAGQLLAIKGQRAELELEEGQEALLSTGGVARGIRECGTGMVEPPTRVVVIERRDEVT
jgi:16S rRNA (guanine527-N7)-methyltransferase